MPRPWKTVAEVDTDEGRMTLIERGPGDFLIRMPDYILMTSRSHRSEVALGRAACAALGPRPRARALVAGLGMGYTLRAVLDGLPDDAAVTVAELNPVVLEWCRGPLAELTDSAVADPRVDVRVTDVAALIGAAARGRPFDAIVLDLYQGTHGANDDAADPFFGRAALERTHRALTPDGVLAVWTEEPDPPFERRLERSGFTVERVRPPRGGSRHVVYVARRRDRPAPPPAQRRRRHRR